jgi:predicted nuclease of predicted toxin-antitoxin system
MRFKVDENLPLEFVDLLRTAGYDALSVHDQLLSGKSDDIVACVCRDEGRILVTLDLDFSDTRKYPPEEYAGLIVLRPARQSTDEFVALGNRLLLALLTEPIQGRLWIVDPKRIRVRGVSA